MSSKSMRNYARLFATAAAMTLISATTASAHIIDARTAVGNVIFTSPTLTVFLPGMTSNPFANTPGQAFIVTFTAECAVNAPAGNTTAWTDVDIQVYNASTNAIVTTLSPTAGTGDAFCSADGSAGLSGWQSNSITAVGGSNLPPAVYRIAVRARLNNGATQASYGERTLIVSR